MDIKTIQKILDIRNFTLKLKVKVKFSNAITLTVTVVHPYMGSTWHLPADFYNVIKEYFTYDIEFVSWLNHEIENEKFERDMQKYLDLKAFI
jgi:hypothetical protein